MYKIVPKINSKMISKIGIGIALCAALFVFVGCPDGIGPRGELPGNGGCRQ